MPIKRAKPTNVNRPALVVGFGASAGGSYALKEVFSRLKRSESVAYIVIQHLDESATRVALDALETMTSSSVLEIVNGMRLAAGQVYLVPPHSLVGIDKGVFTVKKAENAVERLSAIDHIFKAIAGEFKERCVGVVLSGEASDGVVGLQQINEAGGMTIAQNPDSAEHRSMPEAAIAAGVIDYVLEPEEISREIEAYATHVGDTDGDTDQELLKEQINSALTGICELLYKQTRHDFKHYKTSTLVRRIFRRMQVLQINAVEAYIEILRTSAEEIDSLFNELLINVTSFFRDTEAFQALKFEALAPLLQEAVPGHRVRIWVAGCSTGEEAYSIAMMCSELRSEMEQAPEVQILATDIDEFALNTARKGAYPSTIVSSVSPDRLSRFFTKRGGRYHVNKELREMCLFSIHNLINDPPFSQIDLITCRNVLIYLGPHLQKKLFPVFHYSLRPGGYLFLGTSESLTSHRELFKTLSSKHRIAQRKTTAIRPVTSFSGSIQSYLSNLAENGKAAEVDMALVAQRIALDEMPLKYAVVNDEGQILTVSAGITKYVDIAEGPFQNNIIKMAKPSLRAPLRTAFNAAKQEKRKITNETCALKTDGLTERVCIIVQPMPQLGEEGGLYWIAFQYMGSFGKLVEAGEEIDLLEADSNTIEQLENELSALREDLDNTIQDLEASNEELKSSNEELLSMNEELQSANEELETSKEEVQIANEALQRANSDLENLLASTQIATLFLDDSLRIRGFTPAVADIYRIQANDVGREISDFAGRARLMPAFPDPRKITDETTDEVEITMPDGRIFLRRVLPYRTHEKVREGIVVTFIDVTDLRKSEHRLQERTEQLRLALTAGRLGTFFWNVDSGEASWSEEAYRIFGFEAERPPVTYELFLQRIHPDDRVAADRVVRDAISSNESFTIEFRILTPDGKERWVLEHGRPFKGRAEDGTSLLGTVQDITERKVAQIEFERNVDMSPAMLWITEADGSCTYLSQQWSEHTGQLVSDGLGFGWLKMVHPEDMPTAERIFVDAIERRVPFSFDYRLKTKSGEYRWAIDAGNPRFDTVGKFLGFAGNVIDIHERVLLEDKRRESEKRFQIMADSAPVLVWLSNTEKLCTWFNKGWLEWTGRTLEQEYGEGWADGVHPEDFERCLKIYNESFDAREPFYMEYRLRHHSGEYRWISDRGVPRLTPEGIFEGYIGGCMDIHDQKRAEEDLRASEEKFRSFAETMPQMAFISDPAGNITYYNSRWYDYVNGLEGTEGWGWRDKPVHHPDDLQRTVERWSRSLRTGEPYEIEYRLRRYDGEYRWHLGRAIPIRSSEGKILAWFGTNTDITAVKQAEARVKESEERLNLALVAGKIGFWDWNGKTGVLYVSDTLMQDWGIDPRTFEHTLEECLGRIHFEDRDRVWNEIKIAMVGGLPYDVEYRVVRPSGEIIWINAKGRYMVDKERDVERLTGITINITNRKRAAEELRAAKEEAERASLTKTVFLANMSHEIRTPLAAILGFSDLLKGHFTEDKDAESYRDRIARNASQLGRLIDELLDLSKIEADKLEVDLRPIPLGNLIDDVLSTVSFRAQEKGLELDVVWKSERPELITTDPVRFRQILVNVIGNAVKFTERGRVSISFDIASEGRARLLVARVVDTGIGLTAEQRARIFEPFMQGDPSVSRRFGGTGLGLALSKRLAALLGGDLTLERSEPGVGSEFKVTVVVGAVEEQVADERPQYVERPQGNGSLVGKRLLIVDDSPDNRTIVSLFLRGTGADCDTTASGEEALTLVEEKSYDLILMDIQMPVMDGYQTLAKMKASGLATPIVALSAHAFKEERDKAIRAGFTSYLSKPITKSVLVEHVTELLS